MDLMGTYTRKVDGKKHSMDLEWKDLDEERLWDLIERVGDRVAGAKTALDAERWAKTKALAERLALEYDKRRRGGR
jgi:hypothetical protein